MPRRLSSIGVSHVGGMVHLHFGRTRIDVRHTDAAQFAQWVKIHAKEAKRKNRDRDVLLVVPSIFEALKREPHPEPWSQATRVHEFGAAIAQVVARDTPVAVDHADELVRMAFGGNVGYGIHYSVALPFSHAIRVHARAAKLSTGDDSVRRLASGVLSDAEDNYRRGL